MYLYMFQTHIHHNADPDQGSLHLDSDPKGQKSNWQKLSNTSSIYEHTTTNLENKKIKKMYRSYFYKIRSFAFLPQLSIIISRIDIIFVFSCSVFGTRQHPPCRSGPKNSHIKQIYADPDPKH